jgi:xanthine dehydrogenase accessory factor
MTMTMNKILRSALEAIERGERIAILTLIKVEGSSPGKLGQKMIVHSDGRQEGTVGGGALEHRAIADALEMARRGTGGLLTYTLEPGSPDSIGAICGGSVSVAVEVVGPVARILLCGGGHVAWAFARLCPDLGFAYTVVDERAEMAAAMRFPDAVEITAAHPAEYVASPGLESFSHILVLTHDHALDRETLLAISRTGFSGYVGMIGSRRKWAEVRSSLAEADVPAMWLDRVHCPVGEEIGAQSPAEIAVSIAAQIIKGIRTR